jgi:hypothetical protein
MHDVDKEEGRGEDSPTTMGIAVPKPFEATVQVIVDRRFSHITRDDDDDSRRELGK